MTTTPHNWRKSSYSGEGDGNNCVEVADLHARIAVRDSKDLTQGAFTIPTDAFATFVGYLKSPGRSVSKDL
ncbi:DUF397 domain-containing protein [Streptomyces sp. BH104]|uniref:DUF397 domain-containing protein n=1 Tax=Streptomyces sp. BH104 TaxID=3410407 RepID=UPI003BB53E03